MPVIGTLGSIAEFRQGYIAPLPVVSANASPSNPGIGGTITIVPNTANTGLTVTYVATSNSGNYTGNSTSNTIYVNNMEPFNTYNFEVIGTSAAGNSTGVTTNNITIGCNIVPNGNVSFSNIPQDITITPDGTSLHVVTANRWYKWDRNLDNGQLTANFNTLPFTSTGLTSITCNDSYVYIGGTRTTNNAPYGTFDTSTVWQYKTSSTELISIYGVGANFSPTFSYGTGGSPIFVRASKKNNYLYAMYKKSGNPSTNPYDLQMQVFNLNTTTGNISSVANVTNLAAYNNYFFSTSTIFLTNTPDGNGCYTVINGTANTAKEILSWNNASFVGSTIIANQLSLYRAPISSSDSKSIYVTDGTTYKNYSRNTSTSALTLVSNTASNAQAGVSCTVATIIPAANVLFSRDTTTGNLSTIANSTSFTWTANTTYRAVMSPDGKNIYALGNNSVAIFNTVS